MSESLPLFPQERRHSGHRGTSLSCQQQTCRYRTNEGEIFAAMCGRLSEVVVVISGFLERYCCPPTSMTEESANANMELQRSSIVCPKIETPAIEHRWPGHFVGGGEAAMTLCLSRVCVGSQQSGDRMVPRRKQTTTFIIAAECRMYSYWRSSRLSRNFVTRVGRIAEHLPRWLESGRRHSIASQLRIQCF